MNQLHFTHLRTYSDYSITQSILSVKKILKLAKEHEMIAASLSDIHNLSAFVKFYKGCINNKIKPIVSVIANIRKDKDFTYQILLIAKNFEGYKQICHMLSDSIVNHQELGIPYIPEITIFDILSKQSIDSQNIIVLSGFDQGEVGKFLMQKKTAAALQAAQKWKSICGHDYFIELQRSHRNKYTNYLITEMLTIADQVNIPIVATHPIVFAKPQDFLAHEIKVCIASSQYLDDKNRISEFHPDQYYRSSQEMIELFADLPECIQNTEIIYKKCNLEVTLGTYFLPSFSDKPSNDLAQHLIDLARTGLQQRLLEVFSDEKIRLEQQPIFENRLEIELKTIIDMNFVGYFLIVADFISWAKTHDVPVGPGRGSGAGSLVAFSLGITDVEPLEYDLLFERFLNPERVSMPDFDIDFCPYKREKVIEYVKDKYGAQAVAQIATFGTMSSKAVIKDVGRVLGLPYGLCDKISKFILNTPTKSYSLFEAYDEFPDLKEIIDTGDDDVKRLWELSIELEDLVRNVGKHAAGIVIAPNSISDFCPVYWHEGEMQTAQLDKDDIETMGLIKFDFLGLTNLTVIQDTIKNVKMLYNKDIKLSNYVFDDQAVYQLLQKGNTQAVFQLESPGIKRITMKVSPSRFEDLVAILALYRPGPLGSGMVDDFIQRKHGKVAIDYMHESLKTCLEPTYGVIVYQEQVMQISQTVGGYSLGGADLLRRAMGKKKPEEMAKHKEIFIDGAIKNGYSQELAEKLFDLMAMFAEYGFNKSHTVAYAVISYHTAYLKAHYPSCFLAATLSHVLDKTEKHAELYQDCILNNVELLPPDINQSYYTFIPLHEKQIAYALGAIKGIGEAVALAIVTNREEQGEFTSIENFCARFDKKLINKRVLENLIKAGCFDKLDNNRFKLLQNVPMLLDHCEQSNNNQSQDSLFNLSSDQSNMLGIKLKDFPKWSLIEQLNQEKMVLGYFLTADIFDEYKIYIDALKCTAISNLFNSFDKQHAYKKQEKTSYKIAGIVNYIGARTTKNGGQMLFVQISDGTNDIECVLFSKQSQQYRNLIKMDTVIVVTGELSYDMFREQLKLNVDTLQTIDQALCSQIKTLTVHLASDSKYKKFLELTELSAENPTSVVIKYSVEENIIVALELSGEFKIIPNITQLQKLTATQIKIDLS
jgi:DNA polymerase-3 subunit alpha